MGVGLVWLGAAAGLCALGRWAMALALPLPKVEISRCVLAPGESAQVAVFPRWPLKTAQYKITVFRVEHHLDKDGEKRTESRAVSAGELTDTRAPYPTPAEAAAPHVVAIAIPEEITPQGESVPPFVEVERALPEKSVAWFIAVEPVLRSWPTRPGHFPVLGKHGPERAQRVRTQNAHSTRRPLAVLSDR